MSIKLAEDSNLIYASFRNKIIDKVVTKLGMEVSTRSWWLNRR